MGEGAMGWAWLMVSARKQCGVVCLIYWSGKLDAGEAAWTAGWTVGVGHLVGVHGWSCGGRSDGSDGTYFSNSSTWLVSGAK